jgi:hypothetical protein
MNAQPTGNVHGTGPGATDIPTLNSLALRSLVSFFDERTQLFRERITPGANGFGRDETSRKHTIVALLGLHRLTEAGAAQPFDISTIQDVAFQNRSWVKSAGDLGLLTWFTAVCCPDRLRVVFDEFDFENALTTYEDGREAQVAGVSEFLAGIAHARLACPNLPQDLTDVAVDAYRVIRDNQSQEGIFGHAGAARFPRRAFFRRLGTFSDQMCATSALSTFARAFQIEEPLEAALACGNAVCTLQGEMGQWWFLYDKQTCRVVGRYPVLSSHQYGTAPCALLSLEEATGRSFHEAIVKGLSWLAGANELGRDLRNVDRGFIWDSIERRRRLGKYWDLMLGLLRPSRKTDVDDLSVRYEARPDHPGWLLYAFGKFGLPKAATAAKVATTF